MNPSLIIGVALAAVGILVIAAVMMSASLTSRRRQQMLGSDDPVIPVNLATVNDAVLVAQVGGRVTFANDVARQWFALDSEEPDLWLLSQRAEPHNAFLELFATEGQASFAISGRKVRATSHRVATVEGAQFIVVIREETPLPVLDREERGSPQALQVISEISREINASLDLDTTLEAIVSGINRLIQYDAAQICIWDPEREVMRPVIRRGPQQFTTTVHEQVYRRDEGMTGWIARKRQPVLLSNYEENRGAGPLPPTPIKRLPTEPQTASYLGTPLSAANRFIGTLELYASVPDRFDSADQAILALLSEQAATSIENARRYSTQAERVAELSGLQKIAAAISDLQDPRQLYAQLGQRISELMETEMAGVLLYVRDQERLIPQKPIFGVPDALVSRYSIPLTPGSAVQGLWQEVPYWYSNNVSDDHLIAELNLGELVEMAGLRTTAMATMTVGDENIGVLQVANKQDGTAFTIEDIRLLEIYASQVAIVVASARLYGQEQSRVAELQGLQQIVQAMSSFTNPDELYAQLGRRIAELMQVDICGILIHDIEQDHLVARKPFYGMTDDVVEQYAITISKRGFAREVWREHELYLSNSVFTDDTIDLLGVRDITRRAGIRTVMLAPLSAGGRRFGMLQVSNRSDGTDFDDDDRRLIAIFAGQAAALIDNARLYQDTDTTLRKRAAELRSVSRINRELNATLELERILEVIAVEAQRAEGARWGALSMFDWDRERSEIMSTMNFGANIGREARALEKVVARTKDTLTIENFDTTPQYVPPIEGARSALLVPIIFEGNPVGVISLYSDRPNGLGSSAAEFVQALSSQATIAVTNTTRHAEQVERSEIIRRRADQMNQIFELGRAFRSDQSVETNLSSVAQAIAETAGFDITLIGVLDQSGTLMRHAAQSGIPAEVFELLSQRDMTWDVIAEAMGDKYRTSGSYLIPQTDSEPLLKELGLPIHPIDMPDLPALAGMPDQWRNGDVLIIPLHSSGGENIGALIVDEPRNFRHPNRDVIELLEIFANQASVVIENSRLYHSVEERAEELARSLQNLEKSYTELDNLSQEMIRKDVELSQANELLNMRAQRLLALHRIMESVDTTRSSEDVLVDIASSVVEEMDIDQCLIVLSGSKESKDLKFVAESGRLPTDLDSSRLISEHTLFQQVIEKNEPVIYASGGKRGTDVAKLAGEIKSQTFAILPLHLTDRSGAMMVSSTRPSVSFGEDDRDMFALLASQIVVEYENALLYRAVQNEASSAASDRDRLQQLHLITTALQQTRSLHDRLVIIARGIRSVGWNKVAVTLISKDKKVSDMATAGYDAGEEEELRGQLLPPEIWERRFDDADFMSLRLGSCYYLAHDHPWVIENLAHVSASDADPSLAADQWHSKDEIYLPMYAGTDIIGVINLRSPGDGRKPTVASLRPIELFVQQASSALENTRLYQETLELQSYTNAVVQSIQQGIIVANAAGTIETVNAYIRNQYGWQEDVVGKDIFQDNVFSPVTGMRKDFEAVVSKGEQIVRTNIKYDAGSDIRTLNIYMYPRFDELQNVTGVVVLSEDVTQRVQLEEDIAQRGQQLAALNEVSRNISEKLDADAVITATLDQASEVITYDHLELWLRSGKSVQALELHGVRGSKRDEESVGLKVDIATVPQFDQIARDNMPLLLDDRPLAEDEGEQLRSWLGVPMVSGGNMVGIMVFEKSEPQAYAPGDAQVAAAFANQVAVALENARLFEAAEDRAAELQNRSQRLQLLNRISSTMGASLDQNSILQTAIDELRTGLGAASGTVYMFNRDTGTANLALQSPSNPDGSVLDESFTIGTSTLVDHILTSKVPFPVNNINKEPLLESIRPFLAKRDTSAVLIIPLIVGSIPVGMMCIEEKQEGFAWEPEQIELAQTITNQAGISVQNAQLFEETVSRQHDQSILFEAGRIAASSLDLETIAQNAVEYFAQSLNAAGCRISLVQPLSQVLTTLAEYPAKNGNGSRTKGTGPLSHPVTLARLSKQGTVILNDDQPGLDEQETAWLAESGITSLVMVPLEVQDKIIGLIELWQTSQDMHFSQRVVRLSRALAPTMSTAIENARLHDETESRLGELSIINEMSRALTQIISLEDLYQTLQNQLSRVVNARSLTIALQDPVTKKVTFPLAVRNGQRLQVDPIDAGSDPYSYVALQADSLLVVQDIDQKFKELGIRHNEEGLKSFLAVRLESGEMRGALAVEDYDTDFAFTDANLRVLNPIASQVAVSIENARLYGELEQRLSETTTLQEVSRVINSALDLQEIFERVVSELAEAFGYPLIALFEVEDKELVMRTYQGYNVSEADNFARLGFDEGIIGRAARTGESQLVQDLSADADYIPVRDWVHSELAVPIISDEEVLGVLSVSTGADKLLKNNDVALLRTFAGQVAAAVINARLFAQMVALSEELEQRVEERTRELRAERDRIDTLYRIAVELTASLDLDMVLNRALELVGQAVGADTGSLFLIDPQSDLLIHRASMMYDEILPPGGRQIPLHRHEGLAGWVMDNRESLVIDNVQLDPRWSNVPGTEKRRSLLGAPLIASSEVLGCIFFNSDTEAAFAPEHLRLVEAAAQQVANSINNAELYRLIRDQAERLGVMLRSQQTEAAKSQAILESVADGVMVSDQAGEIILFNAAAERVLNLRRDRVLGRPATELVGLYGPGADRWGDKIGEWQASPNEYAGEFLSEQIDINDRVVSVHVSPVLHGREYLGLVSVFRDITREVMADRVKSEFVARVSHELRTPMTSIKGYADLILMGAAGDITPQQRRFLETVKSNADRLSHLVNDLLDISKIEQGQFNLEIEPIDFKKLINDILVSFEGRKTQEQRTIPIRTDIPDDLPYVEGDYERIVQALSNLVTNAYNYTEDDGQVMIRIEPNRDGIQIDIEDTGIGIPAEDQGKVFERFYRGESHPVVFKTAGTGLGLSIVKQIIEMHRGRIWLESEENVGTTFSVFLPYQFYDNTDQTAAA